MSDQLEVLELVVARLDAFDIAYMITGSLTASDEPLVTSAIAALRAPSAL